MGWLVSALLATLIVSVLALVIPTLFGPAVAGLAPLLVVVAIIGLGGIWWREADVRRGASLDANGPHGEDDRMEA